MQAPTANRLCYRHCFLTRFREEKIAFMKGLTGVLPRFSRKLKERKILGTLLEEARFLNPFMNRG